MIMTNKILAVALIAALAGGSLGAILMHSKGAASVAAMPTASDSAYPNDAYRNALQTTKRADQASAANLGAAEFKTAEGQTAYKVGFADGVQAAADLGNGSRTTSGTAYRNAPYRTNANSSRVSNNHAQAHGRSFWAKHRDKLTVGMGAGGGAIIGSLFGGKGAAIGDLAGAGGSALYTYKLRKRNKRY
jgi:hypothetical protein